MPDSAFVQVTHNWAAPDSLEEAVSGLRLSDYRYWTLRGILPEGHDLSAEFFYSNQPGLDDSLILSQSDSVVMLYRADASEEWQEVATERYGHWYVGWLTVPELQMGDYTLAVRDTQVGNPETRKRVADPLTIFPNPARDTFSITVENLDKNQLAIYDASGKLLESYWLEPGRRTITWSPGHLPAGAYYLILTSEWDEILARERILYTR
jgi:hypothetical protein